MMEFLRNTTNRKPISYSGHRYGYLADRTTAKKKAAPLLNRTGLNQYNLLKLLAISKYRFQQNGCLVFEKSQPTPRPPSGPSGTGKKYSHIEQKNPQANPRPEKP
jgi:hypothetical protein